MFAQQSVLDFVRWCQIYEGIPVVAAWQSTSYAAEAVQRYMLYIRFVTVAT